VDGRRAGTRGLTSGARHAMIVGQSRKTTLNKKQKDLIRLFIVERLYTEDNAVLLNELCYDEGIEDMLGAREFFEAQVERINKLFNYPEIQLEEAQ
jgi:hypothetical protein